MLILYLKTVILLAEAFGISVTILPVGSSTLVWIRTQNASPSTAGIAAMRGSFGLMNAGNMFRNTSWAVGRFEKRGDTAPESTTEIVADPLELASCGLLDPFGDRTAWKISSAALHIANISVAWSPMVLGSCSSEDRQPNELLKSTNDIALARLFGSKGSANIRNLLPLAFVSYLLPSVEPAGRAVESLYGFPLGTDFGPTLRTWC